MIDISNPAAPVLAGGYGPRGLAYGVAVSDSYAYVADDSAGLQVIDISDPAAPVRVGGYDTSGYAYGVAVSGGYAYVAEDYVGLQVIDISDSAAPVVVGVYDTSCHAYSVAMSGSFAYVADESGGLVILRVGRADLDGDGDVDSGLAGADDLDIFEACVTGPAIPYNPAALPLGCTLTPDGNGKIAADLDADGNVDQTDFGVFQRCLSGEGNLADPACTS